MSRLLDDVREQRGVLLVAVEDDTVCGFVAGYVEEELENRADYFRIADLVVSKGYRRQGIGSSLMCEIEQLATAQDFKRLYVGVLAGNSDVYRLYQELGFDDYAIDLVKRL